MVDEHLVHAVVLMVILWLCLTWCRAAGSTSWNRRVYGPVKRGSTVCGKWGADHVRSAGGVQDQSRRAAGRDSFSGTAVAVAWPLQERQPYPASTAGGHHSKRDHN